MKYSIITINYNNRDGLRKTIESVISQTYKDFEYIVIDGGSTDGSVEIIKHYIDKIDYWVSEKDKGIYNAMNKGILKAKGDYLNFMNSGDSFYNNRVLETILPHMTDSDIIQGQSFNEAIQKIEYRQPTPVTMLNNLYEGSLAHQACFIKRELFYNNLYREDWVIISDWYFFVQELIIKNRVLTNIPYLVSNFDGHGISSTNIELSKKEREKALKELFPEKILIDFEHYKSKESPILDLIPLFNRTQGLQRFIIMTTRTILWIYYRILKNNFSIKI